MCFSVEIDIIPLLLVRSLFRSRYGEREARRGPLNEVAEDFINFFRKFSLLTILFIENLASYLTYRRSFYSLLNLV